MKDLNVTEANTPEARDALRMRAFSVLLALELAENYYYLQPEEMIAHDDLEDSLRKKLGLETDKFVDELYGAINEQMIDWNWQWLTFNGVFEQFYARYQLQQASWFKFGGRDYLLQANESFPDDLTDVTACLMRSDFADKFYQEEEHGHPQESLKSSDTLVVMEAYFSAHHIHHDPSSLISL